jgi:hypothetical protein
MGLDTFWAIFSQTYLVTLLATVSSRCRGQYNDVAFAYSQYKIQNILKVSDQGIRSRVRKKALKNITKSAKQFS